MTLFSFPTGQLHSEVSEFLHKVELPQDFVSYDIAAPLQLLIVLKIF